MSSEEKLPVPPQMLKVEDVARILKYSKPHAYKVVREIQAELEDKGYEIISGRIPMKYFCDRYGL